MRKLLLILLFIVLMALPVFGAISPSIDNKKTYKNAYRWTGKPKDKLLDWAVAIEDAVDGTDGVNFILYIPTTAPATPEKGQLYFDLSGSNLQYYTTGWNIIANSTSSTLDEAYTAGQGITVDIAAMTIAQGDTAWSTLAISSTAGTTNDYDCVTITTASSGYTGDSLYINGIAGSTDIRGDSWNMSQEGALTFSNGEYIENLTTDDIIEFASDDKEDFRLDLSGENIVGFASGSSAVTLEFNALDAFTGVGSITFDAAAATITTTASGDAQDLTLSVTGAHNSSLILTTTGTSTTDALQLLSTVGSTKINSADNLDIDAADEITINTAGGGITITTVGGGITTSVTGADYSIDVVDKSFVLDSGEADADAIWLKATDAGGGINIDCGTGTLDIDVAGAINMTNSTAVDITIDSTAGSVNITGTQEAADAIAILADGTAGGITVGYGTGNMVITGTGASADFTVDGDLISLDATGATNLTLSADASEDMTILVAGAQDSHLILSSEGTSANAMQLTTTAGGIAITNGGASGEDLALDAVLSSLTLNSDEATTDSIKITSTLGGITMTSTAVASAWTHTSTGNADDLTISVAGVTDSSLILASSGTGQNALSLLASGTSASTDSILVDTADGAIRIQADGGTKGDVIIDAESTVSLIAGDAFIPVTTATYDHKVKYIPISAFSATEIIIGGADSLACVGLDAGQVELGSTEGYVATTDETDIIKFILPLPDDFIDTGTAGDLIIYFDVDEQAGEECNITVVIYEYDGAANTTAIVTDALTVTNNQTRAFYTLNTLSGGMGAVAELDQGDSLIFVVNGVAAADDFHLYGLRLVYRVGLQATQ